MAGSGRFHTLLPWRRSAAAPASAAPAKAPPASPATSGIRPPGTAESTRPPADPPRIAHRWLTVTVQRAGPARETPVAGARVVVRSHPVGELRPGEPLARGIARADGTVAFLLPPGRYSVSAREAGGVRAATVVLDRAGGITLTLEDVHQRVGLHVQVERSDLTVVTGARVEVRSLPTQRLVSETVTDEHGVADFLLAPGPYEVRVGDAKARTFLEAGTVLRLTADRACQSRAQPTRYAMKARQAVNYAQQFELGSLRDDGWN